MFMEVCLSHDIVISQLLLIILVLIINHIIFNIISIDCFMQLGLNVISLLIICSSYTIKAILIEKVSKGVIIPSILEQIEVILVILSLLFFYLFEGILYQLSTSVIFVHLKGGHVPQFATCFLGIDVYSIFIVEASIRIQPIPVKVEAIWIVKTSFI